MRVRAARHTAGRLPAACAASRGRASTVFRRSAARLRPPAGRARSTPGGWDRHDAIGLPHTVAVGRNTHREVDLSRNISEAVKDFRGTTWEATIVRAGESVRDLNQLCRQLTKAAAPKCPVTDRSRVRRYDVKARAEVIAEHLAGQFIPNPPATTPKMQKYYTQVENRVEEFLVTASPPLPGDLFITPAALHRIVMRLPKKKAPGPDGISMVALRHASKRAIVGMNRVFNGTLRTGHFSEERKREKIITIPKAGKDPRKPAYHPAIPRGKDV
ncbi:Probable RNA-directed DNA polymerase from transposon X-element [Eumeta japonica]|uniref:Probable RNA-directed DNA polymerase from transposon X-element n=1 Tax=Eumeta variegata TaxID=151549 RepID=A0A4C1UWX0_EUMVA|nr:Probable RNA-directed DNA polymerase from transposon X-element [Eumeta japonica]